MERTISIDFCNTNELPRRVAPRNDGFPFLCHCEEALATAAIYIT